MTTATFTKNERITIQSVTNPAWWTRPVVWSGVRNDLERLALAAEANGLLDSAREWSRLAGIANNKV
jgi:hypothetical protein